MKTPKQAFQSSQWFREFEGILDSESHQQALFSALLQMQMNSPETTDPVLAGIYDQRLVGARQFIKTLSGLCDSVELKKGPEFSNLNHKA